MHASKDVPQYACAVPPKAGTIGNPYLLISTCRLWSKYHDLQCLRRTYIRLPAINGKSLFPEAEAMCKCSGRFCNTSSAAVSLAIRAASSSGRLHPRNQPRAFVNTPFNRSPRAGSWLSGLASQAPMAIITGFPQCRGLSA